ETGVTSFLPTLVSSPLEEMERAAAWPELAAAAPAGGARALGLHLEGPLLAPQRAGAHDRAVIEAAEADPGLLDRMLALPHLRLVTLAPERPGALDRIARLVAAGITVSLGHTDADRDAVRAAASAGARLVTHLYNAMSGFAHRAPGAVGAALTDDRLVLGLIADGVHADPDAVALAVRAAGPGRPGHRRQGGGRHAARALGAGRPPGRGGRALGAPGRRHPGRVGPPPRRRGEKRRRLDRRAAGRGAAHGERGAGARPGPRG